MIALLVFGPVKGAEEVTALRVWAGDTHTRSVFDMTGPVEYRVFTLANPNRLVVDIKGAELGKAISPDQIKGIISGIRSAPRGDDDLRVVFDLGEAVKPKSFLLEPLKNYGHRLVVDLYPEAEEKALSAVRSADTYTRDKDVIVAVDAGHGGEDPGALGASGSQEKHVTLAISKRLVNTLNEMPGMRAVLIRDGDYYIPRRQRFAKARNLKADLFVSIHADAFPDRRAHGKLCLYSL